MSFPFERDGLTLDDVARRAAHERPAQVICRKGSTSLTLAQLNEQAFRAANMGALAARSTSPVTKLCA